MFINTIGVDATSSENRYVFETAELMSGLPLVAVAIGLFGMTQGFLMLGTRPKPVDGSSIADAGVKLKHFLEPFRYP